MNITTQALQNMIRSKAAELGFTACGFAKYEVLEEEAAKLRLWLNSSMQADMAWIEKGFDKRKDIRNIMPDAKSVISLAFNYYTPFEHSENKPKISRYAWGKDYHKVLKKKLKELCGILTSPPSTMTSPNPLLGKEGTKNGLPLGKDECPKDEGVICRAYVDDGPVMDKVWAERAGIGWMGKHTNVINPDFGSWFFICSIITNIEFDTYSTPVEDMCAGCSLCISACPTGAITDEYVVDARKCISYQTIENRGEIPAEINLDGWIFGCDVCQDVCPYNSPKYNHATEEKDFMPKKEILPLIKSQIWQDSGECPKDEGVFNKQTSPNPLLTKEGTLDLTEEEFNELFADSPIKRTKYKGWRRNLERFKD